MDFIRAPYTGMGLYWHDQLEYESFGHVCAYLMQRGMTTIDFGDEVDPNAALLHALHDPATSITSARFITTAQLPPQEKQSRRPPGRIIVSYDYISDEAAAHGDHRAITVEWSEAEWGPLEVMPKQQVQRAPLRQQRGETLLLDLCVQLDPLYANYGFETFGFISCLYDAIYKPPSRDWRNTALCYIHDGILTAEENALFMSGFATVRKLLHGTYFTNTPSARARGHKQSKPLLSPSLPDVLTPALRRFRRAHL